MASPPTTPPDARPPRRIGRRIVVTFLLFALLPLVAFAIVSHSRVKSELVDTARDRLRHELSEIGVSIVERLTLATDSLRLRAASSDPSAPLGAGLSTARLDLVVDAETTDLVDVEMRTRLRDHAVALRLPVRGGRVECWLVMRAPDGDGLVAGRISPAFLFEPSGWERPNATVSIHRTDGRLVFATGPDSPDARELAGAGLGSAVRGSWHVGAGDGARVGDFWEVHATPQFGRNFVVAVRADESTIVAPVRAFDRDFLFAAALTVACVLLASLVRIRRLMTPVGRLVAATVRVARGEFAERVDVEGDDEFGVLGAAFNRMAADLGRRAAIMHAVNEFGASLSAEIDPHSLIMRLIAGSEALFGVDGVMVHVAGADETLRFDHLHIRSAHVDVTGADSIPPVLDQIPAASVVERVRLEAIDEKREHPLQPQLDALAFSYGVPVRHVLVLPMIDDGEVVGSLTLFDPRDDAGALVPFDRDTTETAESLAAQASVAIRNARLRTEFKELFDSLVEVIAVALDEKSPYTGGHCRRVPELAMMILDAVNETRDGPLAAVTYDEADVYEMRVASLLHDCGKVVTPVHVVDKATKLETIVDRIHYVVARLSHVAREREAEELRAAARASGLDLAAVDAHLTETLEALRDDAAFLVHANTGRENMPAEDVDRVRAIAERWTWRDLDGEAHPALDDDEVANLGIRYGTLTPEERRIVNGHMDATLRMLEPLPFPKRLRKVPAIAGSHHERMDGSGFPRGLAGDEIPLRGRILAVADVFEALTASDRPYKSGKTVGTALRIMAAMATNGHLDPDVFATFVASRTWERYASAWLPPEQRDEIDPDEVLAPLGKGREAAVAASSRRAST